MPEASCVGGGVKDAHHILQLLLLHKLTNFELNIFVLLDLKVSDKWEEMQDGIY